MAQKTSYRYLSRKSAACRDRDPGGRPRAQVGRRGMTQRLSLARHGNDADTTRTVPRAPILDAADGRWVLAVRTSEAIEGSMLGPEKREHLLRMGRAFGLTAFDANLVIAIVQDQARRGHPPGECPGAGEHQLAMVAPPGHQHGLLRRRIVFMAVAVTALFFLEVLIIWQAL